LRYRNSLIDDLECGMISKREFIEASYSYIFEKGIKEFRVTKGNEVRIALCNYQYYNTLGKKAMLESTEAYDYDMALSKRMRERALDMYAKKEMVIMRLLETVGYDDVESYFLTMDADHLEGEVYEIVLRSVPRAVFHLVDKRLLSRLIKNGVFSPEKRQSIISDYVNEEY
jgi:hypothetical protein